MMSVYLLLSAADRWTTGVLARNSKGEPCKPNDPHAVCFCLRGAIERVYKTQAGQDYAYRKLICVLRMPEMLFNDNPKTTHADIIDAVRKAGI